MHTNGCSPSCPQVRTLDSTAQNNRKTLSLQMTINWQCRDVYPKVLVFLNMLSMVCPKGNSTESIQQADCGSTVSRRQDNGRVRQWINGDLYWYISVTWTERGRDWEREREGVSLRKMLPFDLSEVQLKHYMNTLKGRNEIEKKKWG